MDATHGQYSRQTRTSCLGDDAVSAVRKFGRKGIAARAGRDAGRSSGWPSVAAARWFTLTHGRIGPASDIITRTTYEPYQAPKRDRARRPRRVAAAAAAHGLLVGLRRPAAVDALVRQIDGGAGDAAAPPRPRFVDGASVSRRRPAARFRLRLRLVRQADERPRLDGHGHGLQSAYGRTGRASATAYARCPVRCRTPRSRTPASTWSSWAPRWSMSIVPMKWSGPPSRALRPGGRFVAVVPNFAAVAFRWFGVDWWPLDPPRHLLHFTPGRCAGSWRCTAWK